MVVKFPNAMVLDTFTGTSQKGRQYGRIKFLDEEYNVWELFVSGDALDTLVAIQPKNAYTLTFELHPGFNGGAALDLKA